jgi:molybdenum cofactor cytidylyltransferase
MIYAVVLAAGASTRMEGKPKALLRDAAGVTYVGRIAIAAREGGAGGVMVVIGPPHGDAIKKALPPGAAPVLNPMPERGMLSSVQAAIQSLPAQCTGVLIWPVDVPFVKPQTVRAILDATPGRLVIPQHGGKGGHPIRVPRARFPELSALDPEAGLKALIEARPQQVERLDVDDPGVTVDIDTPADAAKAQQPPAAAKAEAPAAAKAEAPAAPPSKKKS